MKRLRQPTNKTCGQTCIAMLMGLENADEIVKAMGNRKTTASSLRDNLIFRGFEVSETRRWTQDGLHYVPRTVIAMKQGKTPEGKTWKHWVLIVWEEYPAYDGKGRHLILDPAVNGTHTFEQYRKKGYLDNAKFTSYFKVDKPTPTLAD